MNESISIYEHCVRKLRFMRVTGETSAELKRVADNYKRNFGVDPDKIIEASLAPGPVDGHPYSAAAAQAGKSEVRS